MKYGKYLEQLNKLLDSLVLEHEHETLTAQKDNADSEEVLWSLINMASLALNAKNRIPELDGSGIAQMHGDILGIAMMAIAAGKLSVDELTDDQKKKYSSYINNVADVKPTKLLNYGVNK